MHNKLTILYAAYLVSRFCRWTSPHLYFVISSANLIPLPLLFPSRVKLIRRTKLRWQEPKIESNTSFLLIYINLALSLIQTGLQTPLHEPKKNVLITNQPIWWKPTPSSLYSDNKAPKQELTKAMSIMCGLATV